MDHMPRVAARTLIMFVRTPPNHENTNLGDLVAPLVLAIVFGRYDDGRAVATMGHDKKKKTEYERVRSLEKRGLFDFEVVCPTPLPTAAVVVVDPFSSGSILAARVLHYKLRLVMVFSEVKPNTAVACVCIRPCCVFGHHLRGKLIITRKMP